LHDYLIYTSLLGNDNPGLTGYYLHDLVLARVLTSSTTFTHPECQLHIAQLNIPQIVLSQLLLINQHSHSCIQLWNYNSLKISPTYTWNTW